MSVPPENVIVFPVTLLRATASVNVTFPLKVTFPAVCVNVFI